MSWSRHLLLPTSSDPIWAGGPGRTTPPPTGARDSQLPAVPPDSSRPAVGHTLEGGLGPPAANSSTLCAPCSLELSCLPTCPQLLQFFLCPVTPCLPRLSSTCDDPRSLSTGHGGRDPTSTSQTGTHHILLVHPGSLLAAGSVDTSSIARSPAWPSGHASTPWLLQ